MGGQQPGQQSQAQGDPNLPPRERYASQLTQMRDMGFTNEELNLQVLQQANGNVELAIERMLGMLG